MPLRRFFVLLLPLVLCLLPGCGERPISSRLVLSSMGVECSARPLTAVLEVIREEKNETITVQGESFAALFSAAERQTGEQVYLGALQSIVFSGVPDGSTLREYLRALLADGRLSPNTQIALCGDALSLYDGEALTGDSITALLTRQYTDSRRNGLKELLNLLEGTGRDGLIPWLTTAEGELRETGAIATGQSDYTAPEEPEEICLMVIRVTDEALLQKTGGILQGMSGSPLVQNGMLVGAVTHVFVDEPDRGYAIFAETVRNAEKNLDQTTRNAA